MPHSNLSLFSQVLGLIDRNLFSKIVREHDSDKFSKGITSWTHLVSMLFMQMAGATSLRDISNGLRSATGNLSHFGVGKAPCKSSLSYINKQRDYKVFQDLYFGLLEQLEPSLQRRRAHARRLKRKIFILDASIVPLCLSLFDWAKFRTHKGAVKLHAVLDYDTGLPNYAVITDGKTHEITQAQQMAFPPNSVLVVDRGYVDYQWLFNLDSSGVFFVTRLKSNADIRVVESFITDDNHDHVRTDENIRFVSLKGATEYPKTLRLVRVYDPDNQQMLELLTNNLSWTADTISQLYKARWAVEVFFKHLKQLFRIKSFVGTSPNAVRIQMWCSMIAMLLIHYLKNKAKFKWHLSNLICFIRMNMFAKIDLWYWVHHPIVPEANSPPQLSLI